MIGFLEFALGILFRAVFVVAGIGLMIIGGHGGFRTYLAIQSPLAQSQKQILAQDQSQEQKQLLLELQQMLGDWMIACYGLMIIVGVIIVAFSLLSLVRHMKRGVQHGGVSTDISGGERLRGIAIYGAFGLLFAYLAAGYLYTLTWTIALNVYGEAADAKVVEIWEVTPSTLPAGADRSVAGIYMKYKFPYGGTTVTAQSRIPYPNRKKYSEGASVPVMFFADEASAASPSAHNDLTSAWWFFVKLLAFLAMAVVGLARLWVYLPHDKAGPAYQQ